MGKVVFEYDISRHVKPQRHIQVSGSKVKLTINDKVLHVLETSRDRDLGSAMMVQKAQRVCEKTTKEIDEMVQRLEAELPKLGSLVQRKKAADDCESAFKRRVALLEHELEELPEKQWKKFMEKYGKSKQEYKTYKVDAGVNLAVGTLGVAGSGAAMAGAVHTGGASLVLGVIGMARSVVKLGNVLNLILRDVEKLTIELKGSIETLSKEYEQSKGKAAAKDLTKTMLGAICGAQFFNTAATVGKKAEELTGKAAGTFVSGVKFARAVTAMLNDPKWHQLQRALAGASSAEAKKIEEKLETIGKKFSKLFEKASELNAKAERVEKLLKKLKAELAPLVLKTNTLAIAEKALEAVVSIGFAAGAAGNGIHEAGGEVLKIVQESVTLTDEIAQAGKDLAL